jgi:hypothetical protein
MEQFRKNIPTLPQCFPQYTYLELDFLCKLSSFASYAYHVSDYGCTQCYQNTNDAFDGARLQQHSYNQNMWQY